MARSSKTSAWPTTDVHALRRLAQRLEHDIAVVLQAVPAEHRTASALSRWTGVVRPLCARLVAACEARSEPLEILHALPGVDGVNQVLAAVARKSGSAEARVGAAQAVQCYAELVGLLGGSQAEAQRRAVVLAARERSSGDPMLEARAALFEGAAKVADASCDAVVVAHVVGPRRDATPPIAVRRIVSGYVGLKRGPRNLPIVHTFRPPAGATPLPPAPGSASIGLLEDHTTRPLPTIVSRGEPGYECDVLDLAPEATAGAGATLFMQAAASIEVSPIGYELHLALRIPARRAVVDMLLHRSLGYSGPSWGGVYFTGLRGEVRGEPASRWFDRFDELPRPEEYSADRPAPAATEYAAHAALLESAAAEVGAVVAEFRHLRFTIAYPIWSADHILRVRAGGPG